MQIYYEKIIILGNYQLNGNQSCMNIIQRSTNQSATYLPSLSLSLSIHQLPISLPGWLALGYGYEYKYLQKQVTSPFQGQAMPLLAHGLKWFLLSVYSQKSHNNLQGPNMKFSSKIQIKKKKKKYIQNGIYNGMEIVF